MAAGEPVEDAGGAGARPVPGRVREVVYRHTVTVRVTHWVNVLCVTLLLMSGLRIFNSHPALYFGNSGYHGLPPFIQITADEDDVTGELVGITNIAGWIFTTTGVLGVSYNSDGKLVQEAFPDWLTLPGGPGLGLARDWHFAAAWLFVVNGTVYLLSGLFTGHFRRDLLPMPEPFRMQRVIEAFRHGIGLRRPDGAASRRYSLLQRISYAAVVFVLLPLMLLTGLTMSPAVTAAAPLLFDAFGGRQSARTLHFIVANLLILFVLVHLSQVLVAGAVNRVRSMITGRYTIWSERAL